MKLTHLLGVAMLTVATSLAFVSCDKDNKKENEEPVIINQSKDYAKDLVGNYKATMEASAHGQTTQTEVVIKVRTTGKNVLAFDIPKFVGRGETMVEAFTLPNVKVRKKENRYVLTALKQVIPMTMGGPFPESEITTAGLVDKDNTLSMSLAWEPQPGYNVQLAVKNGKKIMQ